MTTMIDIAERQLEQRLVDYRVEDGIAFIELDNPPANTYTYDLMQQLDQAIVQARFDDDVYVLVVSGHGDRFFSAGANIPMMQRVTPGFLYQFSLYANETLNRLEHTPKLTIAALNCHTVGGGLEMALACDVRLAKQGAGRIGLPEVNLGVLPGLGGTQRLAKVVGKALAIEMMAKGGTFLFDRGKELGLIDERGLWFDVIAGVTAGAVNAATLAQAHDPDELATELEHLRSVWLGLRGSHDVSRRRWLGALGTVLARRASLYNAAPLRGVLAGHIDPARVAASPIRLRIGYVDLLSGRYCTAGNDHPTLVDAVLASCALPLIFPPVPLGDGHELAVDGGLRSATPLADALHALAETRATDDEPDEAWVLAPHLAGPTPQPPPPHWPCAAPPST